MSRREYIQLLITLAAVRIVNARPAVTFQPDHLTTESGQRLGFLIEPLTIPEDRGLN